VPGLTEVVQGGGEGGIPIWGIVLVASLLFGGIVIVLLILALGRHGPNRRGVLRP